MLAVAGNLKNKTTMLFLKRVKKQWETSSSQETTKIRSQSSIKFVKEQMTYSICLHKEIKRAKSRLAFTDQS